MPPAPSTGPLPSLGVVILGAGASERMGRPKLLLPWGGGTVVARLIAQWRALAAAQIVVVCRPDDAALLAELAALGLPAADRIVNPAPRRGMFSSIQCAASWTGWRPELEVWAIVLGDQPHLRPETLETLRRFQAGHPGAICQPCQAGRAGHPVLLPRRQFMALAGGPWEQLKDFLKQNQAGTVKCPVEDPGLSLDMDTPQEYQQLQTKIVAHEKR